MLLLTCAPCRAPPPAVARAPPPPPPAPARAPPPPPRPPATAASAKEAIAKVPRTRAANEARNNLRNDFFMLTLLYLVFNGTISIFVAPLGGVNLKTESLKVGFKFQLIRETDCGRASSARLVITTLRGSGLLPVVIQSCQSIVPWRKAY